MRTAFDGIDVVDVGIDLLGVAVVVLEGNVDGDDLVGSHAHRLGNHVLGIGVEVGDELRKTFLRVELVAAENLVPGGLVVAVLVHLELIDHLTQVPEGDVDALVEEGQLAQPAGEGVILVNRRLREDRGVGMEGDDGAGIVAGADHLDGTEGLALGIPLLEHLALAVHLGDQEVGKGVDAGDTHAVQTAGNLVAVLGELAAGMEDGKDHLQCGAMLLGMHARGDASSVILYTYGIVFFDGDVDPVAETCHGFVDTVVDHFVHQVMKASLRNVSDIHRRPFPHCLKPFQDLDAVSGILLFRHSCLFVLYHYPYKKICLY